MTLHLSRPMSTSRSRRVIATGQWHFYQRQRRINRHHGRVTYYVVDGRAIRWYQMGL